MTNYVILKTLAFPHFAAWASDLMVIVIGGVAAAVTGCSLLKARPKTSGRESAEFRLHTGNATPEDEAQFRLPFLYSPLLTWVYDLDTFRIQEANRVAVRRYGYSREEFLSMSISDLQPGKDRQPPLSGARSGPVGSRLAETGRHQKKDGSLICVETFTSPVTLAGRRASMVIAIDVTRCKHIEQELAHERNLVDALMENIPDTIRTENFWRRC